MLTSPFTSAGMAGRHLPSVVVVRRTFTACASVGSRRGLWTAVGVPGDWQVSQPLQDMAEFASVAWIPREIGPPVVPEGVEVQVTGSIAGG
jgi:hypothetical protein